MISVLVAFVGGVLALLPVLLVSPRRRQLHMLRDEVAVIKDMPEGPARTKLEAAHVATADSYERRVKGLDKVDILRRRTYVLLPVGYFGVGLAFFGLYQRQDIAAYFDARVTTLTAVLIVVGVLTAAPLAINGLMFLSAVRARNDRVDEEVKAREVQNSRLEASRKQQQDFRDALADYNRRVASSNVKIDKGIREQIRKALEGGFGNQQVHAESEFRRSRPKGPATQPQPELTEPNLPDEPEDPEAGVRARTH